MNAPYLDIHTVTAKNLADALRERGFNDDDDLICDTIEGETDAMEALSKVLQWIAERTAYAAALKAVEGDNAIRRKRYEESVDSARKAVLAFMDAVGVAKIERPEGTLSVRDGKPSLIYAADFDPGKLPADLARTKREPAADLIKAALEAGREVPGAMLSNGSRVLTVRTK